MDIAPADDCAEVLFHQKGIGSELVFMVQMHTTAVRITELIVHRYELPFGLYQIVQDASQAKRAALQGETKQLFRRIELWVVE
jgi:hypothetical protein